MAESIYWARSEKVADAIVTLPVTDTTVMLLEELPTTWLSEEERENGLRLEYFDPSIDFNIWGCGRIFDDTFEMRWERMDGAFQIVYCGPEITLPGFERVSEVDLSVCIAETRRYFLWGKKVREQDLEIIGRPSDEQLFIELQIPRLLHYPVAVSAQRVRLQVCEYWDSAGTLVYYRFQGLEASNEPV